MTKDKRAVSQRTKLPHAPTATAAARDPQNLARTRLGGPRLVAAWVALAAVAILALELFVVSLPALYNQLIDPDETVRASLTQLGISVSSYAVYRGALAVVFVLGYSAVAAVIAWRRPDDWMALFVSLFLLTFGTSVSLPLAGLSEVPATLAPLYSLVSFLGWTSLSLFFYLFPDGRFVPRWTWLVAILVIGLQVPMNFFPDAHFGSDAWHPAFLAAVTLGIWGSAAYAQVYRYRRVSGGVQRQQTKWAVFGFTAAAMVSLGVGLPALIFPPLDQPGSLYILIGESLIFVGLLLMPFSLAMAILRYKLFDIDVVINRAFVYGALSVSVIGIYVLIVGYLGAVFRTGGNLFISLVATGLVAVLFQPLRERLQRGVNRLMYGERDDPYAVLSRLGRRLEATLAPDAVLSTIAQTVREALRLPYAAITLSRKKGDEGREVPETAAEAGKPVGKLVRLPLAYQNEPMGELLVAPRPGEEELSLADGHLLEDLARQAGVAVHAVGLTADLQRSRERLVTAREEERRRLRRDLHDGLGAQLAGLNVQSAVLRRLIRRDPEAAEELVLELRTELQGAIADIRRLVYDLRPPALDELGLVGALERLAERYGAEDGDLRVRVQAPQEMPLLPAAVEVAIYRISQEALTNVTRHARAKNCLLRLAVANEATLKITDDGIGIPEERSAGVGLSSMRERAEELGGDCSIEALPDGGTQVFARLPLGGEGERK